MKSASAEIIQKMGRTGRRCRSSTPTGHRPTDPKKRGSVSLHAGRKPQALRGLLKRVGGRRERLRRGAQAIHDWLAIQQLLLLSTYDHIHYSSAFKARPIHLLADQAIDEPNVNQGVAKAPLTADHNRTA